jgi:exodeoxyribonuclease VII large subunit
MSSPGTYSLLELNQYIRRVITLNFDEPIWIECEIGQASLSRGHWYIDLIQKDENQLVAQCQAVLWANTYFFLRRKSPILPDDILKQGMSVKLKVNVDYHERYGLKLVIEDLDSSFTIGQLEMQRQAILKRLKDENLIRRNAETHMPVVVQRMAIISSDRAAGYKDFVKHLHDNVYGYAFDVALFESAMQGQQVEAEVLKCLDDIEKSIRDYDCVAIIRGGGSRTDLAAFDNLALALRVAKFPIPVLIGIGHEIDQSVLDLVCYHSLKTPTAVADYLVAHNADFESALEQLGVQLKEVVEAQVNTQHDRITYLIRGLHSGIKSRLRVEFQKLEHARSSMLQAGRQLVRMQGQRLTHIESLLQAMNPDQVLARGYTITSMDGKTITHANEVERGTIIQTTFHDGTLKSKVE